MAKPPAKSAAKTPAKSAAKAPTKADAKNVLAAVKPFVGKKTVIELKWNENPKKKVAIEFFDWAKADQDDRDDLLNDTFGDGIIEAMMIEGDDGTEFKPFAVPFAYLGYPSDDDWIAQHDGLLICDTRDGSVHLVEIDGTALFDYVKKIAPSVEALKLRLATKDEDFD